MNLTDMIAAMLASWRGKRANKIIEQPPAKHPKPHREHPEWKLTKRERKHREHIRHMSRRKRR